ncbi:MAG: YceI family protein [Myxococcota bacterium]|nr:YceI family protein [Myxococcota bacterium]
MHWSRYLGLTAISAALVGTSIDAPAAISGLTDGRVAFVASGPAGMKIEGATSDLQVADKVDDIVITVPLANLTTGIGLRDKHMKEKYLEVQKYPLATLRVVRNSLKLPSADDKIETDVPSTINIHGQVRPATVHYEVKRDGTTLVARGRLHINITDFGITVPSYLGVTVKPDIDVTANFRVAGG